MSAATAPSIEAALSGLFDRISAPAARRIGVDAVDIADLSRQLDIGGPKLARRWFTESELTFADGERDRLAATLAGKEAVAKVLGTGIRGPVRWRSIEILRRANGAPYVVLRAGARDRASALGLCEVAISLCHEANMAIAAAIGVAATGSSS